MYRLGDYVTPKQDMKEFIHELISGEAYQITALDSYKKDQIFCLNDGNWWWIGSRFTRHQPPEETQNKWWEPDVL